MLSLIRSRLLASSRLAREAVREQAQFVNCAAEETSANGYDKTLYGAQAIATDLISQFLLPEVQKQARRTAIQANQRKFVQAAHKVRRNSALTPSLLQ